MTLYLLSGPQTNRVGLFHLSLGSAAEDVGGTLRTIEKRIRTACETFAWQFDHIASVLWIPSWWDFNAVKGNIQNFQGALADLHELPSTYLLSEFCANTSYLPEEALPFLKPWALLGQRSGSARTQETTQETTQELEKETAVEFSPADLLAMWNLKAKAAGLSPCLGLGGDRLDHAKARLKTRPTAAYWEQVIDRIAASDFCRGQNERGWIADMEFLLRKSSHLKVLEGKYDNRRSHGPSMNKSTTSVVEALKRTVSYD